MLNLLSMYKIVEVTNKKDLKKFISFPDELYDRCPQYVPMLHKQETYALMSVSTLSYCSRKMWLAMEGKKVVGRICGIINPRYNDLYHTRRARFGWFDCINDIEVARLLLGEAESWAKKEGMTEIHGPLYYNSLRDQGMVCEGFENVPPFNCRYNYQYYNDLVDALGYEKECEWVQSIMVANHGVPDKARRVAALCLEKYNLHFASVDEIKGDPEKVRRFLKIYNDTFVSSVYNFVPFSDQEMEEIADIYPKYMSDRSCCILCDEKDNVVAFAMTMPDIAKALKKMKGHCFPFGWIHLLRAKNDFELVHLVMEGAVQEWQNKGISSVYYREMGDKAMRIGSRRAISNPQLETTSVSNIWNDYEHDPYMRRRCYIKKIK